MGIGGAIFALSATQAVSQISQGYAQKSEANFNATLLEGKANMIDLQSDIESSKYDRMKGQYLSKSVVNTAGNGLAVSGSPLAVMLNAQTQINIDQAISKFNFEQEKNYTNAQADAQRRAGSAAVKSGYSNAFSTLLQGGASYAMYKIPMKSTTFDYSTKTPAQAFSNTAPYKTPNTRIF